MSLPFKQANAILARDILGFCRRYLPRGAQKGQWWLVQVPWRIDKTPSLGVNLTSGRWKDFGRENERGDLVDLVCRLENKTPAEVVRELVPDERT